jgi:hypothetical protein
MIDPKKILALFDEPTKNQGLILHYAYQDMPELAHRVIELEGQVDPYWMNRAHELETEVIRLREEAEKLILKWQQKLEHLRANQNNYQMWQVVTGVIMAYETCIDELEQALGAEGSGE